MKEIKLYKSPLKVFKLVLPCLSIVLFGICLITFTDGPTWPGWLSVCFFGIGCLAGSFHLLDRRPQIIINAEGICDQTNKKGLISWIRIKDAYLTNIQGQTNIRLVLDEPFTYSPRTGKPYKDLKNNTKEMGLQELPIRLRFIKVDELRLMEFIVAMAKAESGKREELLKTLLNTTH
ncbi:STM3941 family protein [Xanthocytophaga flava]|uniref:STM3941 family protein n=1 Tax=Xanthocytophaga flava TaxID=3048013 RepID=UPI0028D5DFA0|nr:STM3941 family protein [Xanthocytophaga flavus]MDJ1466339.1 STM3941 family protein [Xanthocytophaga flavus]